MQLQQLQLQHLREAFFDWSSTGSIPLMAVAPDKLARGGPEVRRLPGEGEGGYFSISQP
jgi:hypothetical protein